MNEMPFSISSSHWLAAFWSGWIIVGSAWGQASSDPDNSLGTSPVDRKSRSLSSAEQYQTPLFDAFELEWRQWQLETRKEALRDTQFSLDPRMYYLHRDQHDGSVSEGLAIGGSAGLKTGYFLDRVAFGLTGYTSQPIHAPEGRDGTGLFAPGQEGYSVLGELYVDVRLKDDWNLFVGRKEYDSPFINTNDWRMTPDTFDAAVVQGRGEVGDRGAKIKGGFGYFSRILKQTSDSSIPMSEAVGAEVDRGVFVGGAVYERGNFTFGMADYFSPDIMNIAYVESTLAIPLGGDIEALLSAQFIDQRSVGDELLEGGGFSGQQVGLKVDVPVGDALFSAGFTHVTDGSDMRNPWSGYAGYTGVQVNDFNRAGESAVLLRAAYEFPCFDGLSVYGLAVLGSDPADADEYAKSEYNLNLQWDPSQGKFEGLSVRVRYSLVEQDGEDSKDLRDFRIIANYGWTF